MDIRVMRGEQSTVSHFLIFNFGNVAHEHTASGANVEMDFSVVICVSSFTLFAMFWCKCKVQSRLSTCLCDWRSVELSNRSMQRKRAPDSRRVSMALAQFFICPFKVLYLCEIRGRYMFIYRLPSIGI